MGAGCLLLVLSPKKSLFGLNCVSWSLQIFRVFSSKSGFPSKKGLFCPARERLLYYEQREPTSGAKGMQCPQNTPPQADRKCVVCVEVVSSHFSVPTHVIGSLRKWNRHNLSRTGIWHHLGTHRMQVSPGRERFLF